MFYICKCASFVDRLRDSVAGNGKDMLLGQVLHSLLSGRTMAGMLSEGGGGGFKAGPVRSLISCGCDTVSAV